MEKTRILPRILIVYASRFGSTSEIAQEIGFNVRQVYRVYIPLGLPHKRDKLNHIWINGHVFRDWIKEIYRKSNLRENEVFCLTCKRPVKMVNPEGLDVDESGQ